MAVLASQRTLSDMEFFKNAVNLRKDVTKWMLKNFGEKKSFKDISCVLNNKASEEDIEVVSNVFAKYGQDFKKQFKIGYDTWFLDFEKTRISEILASLMDNIALANTIYPIKEAELDARRVLQDKAIGICYDLMQEIQFVYDIIQGDLNDTNSIAVLVEKEIALLKGWRTSCEKQYKKMNK